MNPSSLVDDDESRHFRDIYWRDLTFTHANEFQWIFFWDLMNHFFGDFKILIPKNGDFSVFFVDALFGGSQYFMKFLGFVHFSSSHGLIGIFQVFGRIFLWSPQRCQVSDTTQ